MQLHRHGILLAINGAIMKNQTDYSGLVKHLVKGYVEPEPVVQPRWDAVTSLLSQQPIEPPFLEIMSPTETRWSLPNFEESN